MKYVTLYKYKASTTSENMFEVYRDIPAKHKISTEGCENKTSSASQTTLSWNSIEGRFYRDSNGKISIYDLFA